MNNTIQRTKPPYSQRLAVLLSSADYAQLAGTSATRQGLSVYVIAGSSGWDKAREIERTHAFLLAPHGENPDNFDWSILAGHDPIHIIVEGEISHEELYALAVAMDRDGTNRVLYPKGDGTALRYLSQRVIENGQ